MAIAGKAAKASGITFDEFNGIVGSVAEATNRSGTMIGNAFKRMFERISAPEGARKLQDLGVLVFDAAGNIRPFIDILENVKN